MAAFDPAGQMKDAMAVVDADPVSPTYGAVVGWTELPTAGNELHHFGWNACSQRAVPRGPRHTAHARAPLPDRARPALLAHLRARHQARSAPARRWSRTIEADELASQGRLLPAAHACTAGPAASSCPASAAPTARRAPAASRCSTTTRSRSSGSGRPTAAAVPRLRRVVAPQSRHRDHLGVGHPVDDRGRRSTPTLLGRKYGHRLHFWDMRSASTSRRIDLGDRAPDGARAAPGARPDQDVRVRRRRRSASRTCRPRSGCGTEATAVGGEEGHHDPGRARRRRRPAARAAALRRGAAAGHRHRSVGRRPLAVRVLLGHRRAQAVRRQRPVPPAGDRLGPARRHRRPHSPPGRPGPAAGRRTADGRGQPRRQAGLLHQLAVRRRGTTSSTRTASAPGWPSSTWTHGRRHGVDARFFPHGDEFRGPAAPPDPAAGRRRVSDSYCFTK